mgnify:CR=1 FL=1
MATTFIARCFVSTWLWYDMWPFVDDLREKWYTECENINNWKTETIQVVDNIAVYRPYDNTFWSNWNLYWIVELVDLPYDERLRCDWRVQSYLDQNTYEWEYIIK